MAEKSGNRNANKRVRRIAVDVIMVCLALIALVSGYKVYSIMHQYSSDRETYEGISERAQTEEDDGIDFEALAEINQDVVGWLRCDGTVIDYPVVQGTDNDKYLHTLFDGTQGGAGTLFADAETEAPFRQFSTIIYGHHMKDGSMFGGIKELNDPEYCREHPEFELITPDGRYRLRIGAFLNEPADSPLYRSNVTGPQDRADYLDLIKSKAKYLTDTDLTPDDRLVILSTCAYEYENARYVVVCKMLPQ